MEYEDLPQSQEALGPEKRPNHEGLYRARGPEPWKQTEPAGRWLEATWENDRPSTKAQDNEIRG